MVKNTIASVLVIALGVILTIHLVAFWVYGGVYIYESSRAVLILETVMAVLILGFGVERLWASGRRQ